MTIKKTKRPFCIRMKVCFSAVLFLAMMISFNNTTKAQQDTRPSVPPLLQGAMGTIKINDAIYQASGFGNTFLVITREGNVIIDTSSAANAPKHKALLQEINNGPVKYIILTHGHADHRGGVSVWKEPGTEVIAQEKYVEFRHYQQRLAGFFTRRNAAQFPGLPIASRLSSHESSITGNYAAEIEATILFKDFYEFKLGGLTFQLYHTPGETYDHLSVWIPEYKAVFAGDNLMGSFPNLYTLRGTKPRWALDYVETTNNVIRLKPEILISGHGRPIHGNDTITKSLIRYRDAVLYVHDETVRGMNAGKDVFTLMREIKLPNELKISQGYGAVPWSVRGIYEGYVGWFDGNPATMFATPPSAVYPDLVRMAGGSDKVAGRALELIKENRYQEALHIADMALSAEPNNVTALEARLKAFQALVKVSKNTNERSWLNFGIRETEKMLKSASQ